MMSWGGMPAFSVSKLVGAAADLHLARLGVRLALFVEGHDHHRRAVAADQLGLVQKGLFAFLEADGIDDALALHAFEARLDDRPLGRVDHHRHLADVRLRGHQVQERGHGLDAVQHGLVHVDVDDLGAVLHLVPGHIQGGVVFLVEDELLEARRAGDVGALADVDEQRVLADGEGLQAAEAALGLDGGDLPGRVPGHRLGDGLDMVRGRAAAAADDVQEPLLGPLGDVLGHGLGGLVVLAELVGQPGVGVGADVGVRHPGQLLHVLAQLLGAQGAVEADADRVGMGEGVPERLGDLTREGAAAGIGNGARDHDGQVDAPVLEERLDGEDRRLGVEGIEDGLDEQHVRAAVHQAFGGLVIGLGQLVEGGVAKARVVDVRRDGAGAVGGAQHAGNEARLVGLPGGHRVGGLARHLGRISIQLIDQILQLIIGLGNGGRVEGVGLDNVGTGLQIGRMDVADDLRLGDGQQIIVALEVARVVSKALAAIIRLLERIALDHGAHGAVEDQDALFQGLAKGCGLILS